MNLRVGGRLAVVGCAVAAVAALALAGCTGKTTDSGNKSTSLADLKKNDALAGKVPDELRQQDELVIATDASYPPNEFTNDGGKTFVGMDVDLGKAIGKVLGMRVKFVNATFDGILAGVQAGKYDLAMASFTDRADREQIVDFVTYFEAGTSIAVHRGNPLNIKSQADLCGIRVAAERGTTQIDALTKDTSVDGDATLKAQCLTTGRKAPIAVPEPDQNGVNSALVSGRADAFTADSPVVDYQVKLTNGDIEQAGPSTGLAPYGIAIPKDSGSFPQAILGALQELIDNGHYMRVLRTWGVQDGAISNPQINAATSNG